jgi:hypothetical protein
MNQQEYRRQRREMLLANSALRKVIDSGVPLYVLRKEAAEGGYLAPLAKLILDCEKTIERALEPWEFKSLAEYGEETFCSSGEGFTIEKDEWSKWGEIAESNFSFHVCAPLVSHLCATGLILYVQDERGSCRPAAAGDAAYDAILRIQNELVEQKALVYRFSTAPQWAHELFINRINKRVHLHIWSEPDDGIPLPDEYLRAKAEAVRYETLRLSQAAMDAQSGADANAAPANVIQLVTQRQVSGENALVDKPIGTRERNTLLKLVIGMAINGYGHSPGAAKSDAPANIASDLANLGLDVTDDTVRKYLKEAAQTVLPTGKPRKT